MKRYWTSELRASTTNTLNTLNERAPRSRLLAMTPFLTVPPEGVRIPTKWSD